MSSLKELENFSNLKHPIFKGLWIFSKPKEPSWSFSRLFQARIWASIQSLCIPGSIKRFVPPGRGNGPDLGWLKERRKEVRYAWVGEKNRTGTHGDRKGLSSEKEDETAALGIHVHSCINALFGTQFPFWKDKKRRESGREMADLSAEIQICGTYKWLFDGGGHPPPHPTNPTTTSTYFPWSLFAPPEASNPESDGMGTHQECCHSTLHFSVFRITPAAAPVWGTAEPWFLSDFSIFNNNLCNQSVKSCPRGSDGATAMWGDCLPFQRVCVVSGVM